MYCNFYGFNEKPFQEISNSLYIYLSKNHKEAFAHLLYGINWHAGFIELTGEPGSGKIKVIRTLLDQLDASTHKTAIIPAPCLSGLELLGSINREFGLPYEGLENGALLDELNRFLLAENRAGRTVVLVLSNAQNLSPQVLEQVRLISNLETASDKLIQIILSGQPGLGRLLARPELRQLAQRIAVRYRLQPLDAAETSDYIRHRLIVAGRTAELFTAGALLRIYRYSGGLPRLINSACEQALLVGCAAEAQEIDATLMARALDNLKDKSAHGRLLPLRQLLFAGLLTAAGIFIALQLQPRELPSLTTIIQKISPVRKAADKQLQPSAPPAEKPSSPVVPPVAVLPAANSAGIDSPSIPPVSPWAQLPDGPEAAFNAVAAIWKAPTVGSGKNQLSLPEAAANSRLMLTPLRESMATLQSLDSPAILELKVPGAGKRFIALIDVDRERWVTAPTLPDGRSPDRRELTRLWTGRSYLIWRNHQNIPGHLSIETEASDMIRLQILLIGTGFMTSELSGRYDDSTRSALMAFQKSRRLKADGQPNGLTLFLLYREGGKFATPRLAANSQK